MGKTVNDLFVPTEGKEYMLYASMERVKDIGVVELYLGTDNSLKSRFIKGQDNIITEGENLYLVNVVPLGFPLTPTAETVVVTITGTTTETATTGRSTFPKNMEYGRMIKVNSTVGTAKWKTVDGASVAGGAVGDRFALIAMPADSTFEFIEHHTTFSLPTPFRLEPIPHRYEPVVGYWRARADASLSIGSKESHPDAAIRRICGREVVLKLVNQLGGVSDNYLIYIDKVVLNGTLDVPEEGGATYNTEGTFRRYMIPYTIGDWPI